MRLIILFAAIAASLCSTPAFAQVKRWTDAHGVVHYEATGKGAPKGSYPNQPEPNARQSLDRHHASLTLGDNEASFTASKNGDYLGKIGANGNYYRYSGALPQDALAMGTLFIAGRLALVLVEYRDLGPGGWDRLVRQTAEKYGPPQGDAQTASWNDGTTGLTFKRAANGNITVWLEDLAATSRYSEQQIAALPKF